MAGIRHDAEDVRAKLPRTSKAVEIRVMSRNNGAVIFPLDTASAFGHKYNELKRPRHSQSKLPPG